MAHSDNEEDDAPVSPIKGISNELDDNLQTYGILRILHMPFFVFLAIS